MTDREIDNEMSDDEDSMQPRESIPNVGRRARGHRASTFTLKGNGVNNKNNTDATTATTTTTTTTNNNTAKARPLYRPTQTDDAVHHHNSIDDVRERCVDCSSGAGGFAGGREGDGEEGSGGDDEFFRLYHPHHHHHHHLHHHHPYGHIQHRIAHRLRKHRERDDNDNDKTDHPHYPPHNHHHLQPVDEQTADMRGDYSSSSCNSPRTVHRLSRIKYLSHHQHNASKAEHPRNRTSVSDDHHHHHHHHSNTNNHSHHHHHHHQQQQQQQQKKKTNASMRWQGSKVVRRPPGSESKVPPLLPPHKERSQDFPRSRVDLTRGCLTGRNPGHGSDDGEDSQGRLSADMPPDTTRSEPGDLRKQRGGPSPRSPTTSEAALDDLLDYLWVYQGMGRQVLNLDLPREVWDKRIFRRKHLSKLPPIPHSLQDHGNRIQEVGGGGLHPFQSQLPLGYDMGLQSHRISPPRMNVSRRRSLSEPPPLNSPRSKQSPGRSPDGGHGVTGRDLVKSPSLFALRAQGGGASEGPSTSRKQLVVKMPVMTKDRTSADLLDTSE